MGFGTLFFGYFLLLNVTYNSFTDLISALIMATALYKLSSVNKPFKNAFFASFLFAAVGLFELVIAFISMFAPTVDTASFSEYLFVPRYFVICLLTLLILWGIESVAREVGLPALANRAKTAVYFTLPIYTIAAALEVPVITTLIGAKIFVVVGSLTLISTFVIVLINLVTVYRAYMRICMPEDRDNDITDEPSKFEFVNKYREHTQKKQVEYAEYKLEKMKNKSSKKKRK